MEHRVVLFLIIFASTLGQFATDIYTPSLPDLAKIFNTTNELIKNSVTILYFGYAIMQLLCGPLSDLLGRRLFMIIGVGIFLVATFMASQSQDIHYLLCARFFQGLGVGSFGIANRAIIFDLFKGAKYIRAMSTVGIVMTISSLIAPMIGSVIHKYYGWTMNFYVVGFLALVLFIAVLALLPETMHASNREANDNSKVISGFLGKSLNTIRFVLQSYKTLFMSKSFWQFSLINMLGFSGFLFYLSSAPFIFKEQLNYSSIQYGQAICFLAIGYIFGTATGNKLVQKYNREIVIHMGNYSQLTAGLLMLVFYLLQYISVLSILGPMFFFVFGNGLINPSATSLLLNNFPTRAASAAAAMGAFMTMGASMLNVMLFYLNNHSLFFVGQIIFIFAFCIKILIYGSTPKKDGLGEIASIVSKAGT
jgi:DHA1 family bicyclomycin/chloramphenicol resistance-like MFS transporter